MSQVWVAGTMLDTLGVTTDLKWSSTWLYDGICGDKLASWTWTTGARPSWLHAGAEVIVREVGRRAFTGRMNEPEQTDTGWTCSAYGLAAMGQDFDSYEDVADPGDPPEYEPTYVPDTAISSAEDMGLPWTLWSSVGSTSLAADNETDVIGVRDLFLRAAKGQGKRAVVDQWGRALLADDPTTPTWLLHDMGNYLGTADDEFVTKLFGRYVSAVDGDGNPTAISTVYAQDEWAEEKFGAVVMRTVPLDGLGLLLEADAQTNIDNRFSLIGGRMGWTTPFDVSPLWLTAVNSAPGSAAAIRAGQMIRLFGVQDFRTTTGNRATVDLVIGEVEYDADSDTAMVTPMGYVPRDLASATAAATATTDAAA